MVSQRSGLAQLVERWLNTPEVRGSNPVMRKNYIEHLVSPVLKDENKGKRGQEWPILKESSAISKMGL